MTPAELLQFMSFQEKSGTVRFRCDGRELTLVFDGGRIISSGTSERRFQLGELMVQAGFLTEDERAKMIEVRSQSTMSLGSIVVAIGAMTEDELRDLLRWKAEQEVADLLGWPRGEFDYRPDVMPHDELIATSMDVIALLMEASRRRDEVQRSRLASELPPLTRAAS